MADPKKDEATILNLLEFEPLTKILNAVPHKTQRGLFKSDVEWTCIDVTREFVAIGTNSSHVCLYNRANGHVQKLNVREKSCMISCVRLINSVDYEIAVGTTIGHLFVFVLPSILPGKSSQLQMFRMTGFHPSPIRCLEWSRNAMKLFSGDEDGVVVCTEIDYTVNQSKSYVVCKEAHGIVQLSYGYRTLLVSTTFRTVLCKPDSSGNVIQVGQKDRKVLGTYGAVLVPGSRNSEDVTLYASRPGLRLWKARLDGSVQATYIFKDLITARHHNLSLLPDTCQGLVPSYLTECQFGRVLRYQDSCVVTFHENELYVVDMDHGIFRSYHTSLGRIVEVAVCGDELFVLRQVTGRPLLRLAYSPETQTPTVPAIPSSLPLSPSESSVTSPTDLRPSETSPVQVLTDTASKMSLSFVGAMKGVGEKIQSVSQGTKNSVRKIAPWNTSPSGPESSALIKSTESSSSSVESGREMSPSFVPSPPDSSSPTDKKSYTGDYPHTKEHSRKAGNDVPPIVKLEGDKLTVIKIEAQAGKSSPQNTSADKSDMSQGHHRDFDAVGRQEFEEVVYFRKPKKNKKKQTDTDTADDTSSEHSPRSSPRDLVAMETAPSPNVNSRLGSESAKPCVLAERQSGGQSQTLEDKAGDDLGLDINKLRGEESNILDTLLDKCDSCDATLEQVIGKDDNEPPCGLTQQTTNQDTAELQLETCMAQVEQVSPQVKAETQSLPTETTHESIVHPQVQTSASDSRTQESTPELSRTVTPLKIDSNSDVVAPLPDIKSPRTPLSPSKSTESESEDIYTRYGQHFPHSSTQGSLDSEQDIQGAVEQQNAENADVKATLALEESPSRAQLADSWMTFSAPSQVQYLCLTNRHIWVSDKWHKVRYSSLTGGALKWTEVAEHAKLMAVSPSGGIVWRLHKGHIFVALQVSSAEPAGKSSVNIAKDVTYIAVDDTSAWYLKTSGEVAMHKGLSRSVPHSSVVKVTCPYQLVEIACRQGVVWALTSERAIIVRDGITESRQEGLDWRHLHGDGSGLLVSSFALGDRETAWVLDVTGHVWFTTGVSIRNPCGEGHWWQVSMSEYLMQDSRASATLQALWDVSHNLGKKLVPHETGGCIDVSNQGVWMCQGHREVIHACRSNMLGHRWENVILSGMLSSTRWHHVSATAVQEDEGMIWAQQSNGSFFCFPPGFKHARVLEVAPPVAALGSNTVAATSEALWVLQTDGSVYIRGGMGPHCPQGIKWVKLNIMQLGECVFSHLCLGTENVWSVDNAGQVYMRIGIQAPTSAHLSPAWVPVDGCPKESSAKFVKVYVGPDDKMVWALDNKMNVYVRKGITDTLPVGSYWSYVSGTPALSLCVSNKMVYALNQSGELLVRHGIDPDNTDGYYWKKIPGVFSAISVTAEDELWAIDGDDLLHKRHVHCLQRQRTECVVQAASTRGSTEEDWELL